ncbi:hypothetical protein [Mycolicibacterium sp. CR10]|uniref:hypothetical protein n=1 Tax=Mycolicibacterium sp. CR10 TaxID=2562314 RepID=UPI0010BF955A|nr:hypothetical protein [Mycolicibacterium sp. CR10]
MTTEEVRDRLLELQAERTLGEERLAMLDRQRDELRAVILRIDGAVQVLEELLAGDAVVGTAAAVEGG